MSEHTQLDRNLLTKNVSRDILYIIRYLLSLTVSGSRGKERRKINTYLQILKVAMKENGELILRHLIRYEACTQYELYEVYGINYTTIGRILNLLIEGEMVKQVGYVGRPFYNLGDGRQIKIYVLIDADPSASSKAQTRYGEIRQSKKIDPMRQTQLEEAFNLIKLYLDKRETRHIPEVKFIQDILRENEIKGVNTNLLIRHLVKDGYKF